MKATITWRRLKPDTATGYSVQVITTYSSFDKDEIDAVADALKLQISTGIVGDAFVEGSD